MRGDIQRASDLDDLCREHINAFSRAVERG
jgi:hypothetical protein